MSKPWRLATFNLESFDRDDSDRGAFAARVAALRPILEQLDADVLCLQEVNAQGAGGARPRDFSALHELIAGTGYARFHFAHSVNPTSGKPADVHNLVTLSRWPFNHTSQLFHDIIPRFEMPAAEGAGAVEVVFERPVLCVEIAAPQGTTHVLNCHLRAPRAAPVAQDGKGGRWRSNAHWAEGFHLGALKRQAQALETRIAIDRMFDADPGARIALCGDLNADSFETPTRILRGVPDEGDDGPLGARALDMLDCRLPSEQRFSVIHDGRRVMLDHVLASPALASRCATVEALNAALPDEAHQNEPVAGSLHAPVLIVFDG